MRKSEVRSIQKFLLKARELDGDLTVQRLNTLLEIYLAGEIDQSTLIRKAQLSRSAASKNIASWTDLNAYKKSAPGFVRSTPDPMNLKTRILTLTSRGKEAVESLFS